MAKVAFKKGLLADMPATITEGAFYVTTDEHALYLDVDGTTRVRIGDFQEFETLTALQANTNPSTTALYYVTELNCLAKWDGTKYVQINIDTGATSAEVTGDGNALTGVTYDPATRKLTFTKTTTFTTADDVDAQIAAKVGELKVGDETFATVKAYVDKKTDGIATDAALETLTNRVTTAEGKIGTLNGDADTEGSVAKTVNDAIADLDLENNYEAKGANDAAIKAAKDAADAAQAGVDTLVGTDTGKSARTIANEELAKQLIPENADEAMDTLGELSAWLQEHPKSAANINKTISELKALVGTLPDGVTSTTVVAYIKEAIASLEEDTHTHDNKEVLDGITEEKVEAWDSAEQNAKDYADEALTWGTF